MASMSETRRRLPTLFEVISRRTYPPVDLFSFYIFMRDQQRAVDYLDFWYVSIVRKESNGTRYFSSCRRLIGVCNLGSMLRNTCPSADTMSASCAALFSWQLPSSRRA